MRQLSTNVVPENTTRNSNTGLAEKATWLWSPLLLCVFIVFIDQLSKYLVETNIGRNTKYGEIIDLFNGFLWIVKVYNKGIAFSLASDTDWWIRLIIVYTVPLLLVIFLFKIIIYSNFDASFRWYASLVAGGGVGNLIDRFFREEGVVDFISINTYGIFGISRWATFNFADVAVVIGMVLWMITLLKGQKSQAMSQQESASTSESTQESQDAEKNKL